MLTTTPDGPRRIVWVNVSPASRLRLDHSLMGRFRTPNRWMTAMPFCSFTARPDSPAIPTPKDNTAMSQTYLANAVPESLGTTDRRIEPIITPTGAPRVRVSAGFLDTDYFPNAARDMAAALTKHAAEAEEMERAERLRKDEAARAAAKAEAERKAAAAKPYPRAVRPDPINNPTFWIWCTIDGQFFYNYVRPGQYNFGPTKFTPGVHYTHETGRFDPSPANIALWTKLAYDAGQEAF